VSLDGKGWIDLKKKEGVGGKNRGQWKEGFLGLIFLQIIKSSSFGELKNCIGGGFWRV